MSDSGQFARHDDLLIIQLLGNGENERSLPRSTALQPITPREDDPAQASSHREKKERNTIFDNSSPLLLAKYPTQSRCAIELNIGG